MRSVQLLQTVAALLLSGPAAAQAVATGNELLGPDTTESWAMNYVEATTLMTAFGGQPQLDAGQLTIAGDIGSVPRLSQEQQRVGFGGLKQEDLNKSPAFGRIRLGIGLPAGWMAELGWTPPIEINGIRTRDLFAFALGHQLFESDAFAVSARAFGQHGDAEGDITCPADVVGNSDPEINPAGCIGPSRDRIALRHYGADLTAAWDVDRWHWHTTLGVVRMEPTVQVDAPLETVRDRTRLVSRSVRPYLALGGGYDIGARWRASLEILHVPLAVKRDPNGDAEHNGLTSVRVQLRYVFLRSHGG
jgi:hypothetical protein